MPYRWTSTDPDCQRLHLWPHRSLPRAGFAAMILGTFTMITLPLYGLLGTRLMWALLPFLMLAVLALWWGLERSYRDGEIVEDLRITPQDVSLSRENPRASPQHWVCNTYWTRAEIHQTGGPVPWYVTLDGNARKVEIGAFLSEDERRSLYGELCEALNRARSAMQSR